MVEIRSGRVRNCRGTSADLRFWAMYEPRRRRWLESHGALAVTTAPDVREPPVTYRMTAFLLVMGLALLFAFLVAVCAGVLAWLGGANVPNAVLRGGIAFGGTLTVATVLIGLVLAFAHA